MSKSKTQATQAARTANLTNAAAQPNAAAGNKSNHAAELMISLRRILAIAATMTDGDAEKLGFIEYETQNALKAAEGFSQPAIVV